MGDPNAPNQQQTADYVAQMSLALREMAARAGMPRLARLLEDAVKEAIQQGGMPPQQRTKHMNEGGGNGPC